MRALDIALAMGVVLGLCLPSAALANGATASFPAGGVVFHDEAQISIVREDLEIGLDRIRVHYVFHSSAPEPLRLTIGFPMAKVPLSGGTNSLEVRGASMADMRNYMDFRVWANDREIQPDLHEYGWLDGTNITARLEAMQVPAFLRDFGRNLPELTVDTLIEAGFATRYGDYPIVELRWDYQTVYEWQQVFPPGESTVTITYAPLYGVETTEGKYTMFPGEGNYDVRYCFDKAFKARFAAMRAESAYIEPIMLGYILTTAKNWNGPIGEFYLTVKNPEGYLFSFCPPAGLKAVGDNSTWEARDFVPPSDLDMIFFFQDPPP